MQLPNPANLVFHRVGGLGLTTRFEDGKLPVISSGDWKPESFVTDIAFSSGTLLQSTVAVREFVPHFGDVTGRRYTDSRGRHRWVNLPAYGLADPLAYAAFIRTHIPAKARAWASTQGSAHREALRLLDTGMAAELDTLLCYDFGRYQKTRSAYITGHVRLGIEQLPDDAQAMAGQVPLPRMITAQCDIVLSNYLAELLEQLFGSCSDSDSDSNGNINGGANGSLARRLLSTTAIDTHVAYVALRIIAEGTIWILCDKERRDRENNIQDNALQVQLEHDLCSVVAAFASKHYGMDYAQFTSQLPREWAAFYATLDEDSTPATTIGMAPLDERLGHISLTPHCGICGTAMAVGEKCNALLGKNRATAYLRHVSAFLFPDYGHNIQRIGGMLLCRRPGCTRCAASLEACTVHADCFALFQRHCCGHGDRAVLERLWVVAAWRRPWRAAPCLWLDDADRLVSTEWLTRVGSEQDGRGLSGLGLGLQRLPPEIVQMIRLQSATSLLWRYSMVLDLAHRLSSCTASDELLSMPLRRVASWERGGRPVTSAPCSPPPVVVRLTIDACGLRAVERLPSRPSPRSWRSDSHAFVVVDESQIQGATVHFKFGYARLELPATVTGLQVWDTPTPPALSACRWHPAAVTPTTRFYTIALDRIDGLTLFFCLGRPYAIHVHTPCTPCASTTFARLSRRRQRAVTWLYVPFAANDRVVAFGTRRKASDTHFGDGFCFLFRTQLLGDVVVGPALMGPINDVCLGRAPPLTLVYNAVELGAISVTGAYTTGQRVGPKPVAPFCVLPPLTPPFRDAYFSQAPLDHIVRVRVFSDKEHRFCRGLVVAYKNGGMRALGQCRIGVDPVSEYENPSCLCVRRTTYTTQARKETFCAVYVHVATTGDLHSHAEPGWICSAALHGSLEFWFTDYESDLTVVTEE
ncbi:hypothetical protein SPI_03677 [Niveomyces insectorum RCEF 264]|uniref:Uncharacterized protein n=1 Tax=Niveomyces insectorum RCEF 264 TaxID=1081102 RepID=A0A167W9V1_9HYPO|nr:hypothetical protein SPI_03677 [Niveomyces insectorum RCEF 264]